MAIAQVVGRGAGTVRVQWYRVPGGRRAAVRPLGAILAPEGGHAGLAAGVQEIGMSQRDAVVDDHHDRAAHAVGRRLRRVARPGHGLRRQPAGVVAHWQAQVVAAYPVVQGAAGCQGLKERAPDAGRATAQRRPVQVNARHLQPGRVAGGQQVGHGRIRRKLDQQRQPIGVGSLPRCGPEAGEASGLGPGEVGIAACAGLRVGPVDAGEAPPGHGLPAADRAAAHCHS